LCSIPASKPETDGDSRGRELGDYRAHWIATNPFGRLADWMRELLDEGRQS